MPAPPSSSSPVIRLFRKRSAVDWLLTIVLVGGTSYFLTLGWLWPEHQPIVAGLVLLLLAIALRRWSSKITGPMFVYDLLRTARRGNSIGHRFLYGSFVLLAIFLLFSARFPVLSFDEMFSNVSVTKDDLPKLAEAFFALFLCVQIAAVLVVTPAYTAGVIAEEKQRRTLEFILATDLSNREVVLGLLGARLSNLFLLLLTGLPVLGMLQFLGGIDPLLVFCGFIITALTVFSLGAQSILSSVYSRRPLDSIIATYFVAFFTELVPSIITLSALLGNAKEFSQPAYAAVLIFFAAFYHISLGIGSCALAVTNLRAAYLGTDMDRLPPPRRVRPRRSEPAPAPQKLSPEAIQEILGGGPELEAIPVVELAEPETAKGSEMRGWGPGIDSTPMPAAARTDDAHSNGESEPRRLPRRPPPQYDFPIRQPRARCGNDPMIWKEVGYNLDLRFLYERDTWLLGFTLAFLAGGIFCVTLLIDFLAPDSHVGELANPLIRTLSTIVACISLLLMALNTCSKISREREQQTLDSLLTTPLESANILGAKCFAGFWAMLPLTGALALIWAFGILTGGLHIAALPLVLAAYLVYSACLCTLGLWLSMISRTTLRSTLFTLLAAMIMVIGPGLLSRALDPMPVRVGADADVPDLHMLILDDALTPPITLWTLCYSAGRIEQQPYAMLRLTAAVSGLLFYVGVTALMWISMLRRLREMRGGAISAKIQSDAKPQTVGPPSACGLA
jgi:ABC-type transport system involved in multi-copper enzyme maturation permease subunit